MAAPITPRARPPFPSSCFRVAVNLDPLERHRREFLKDRRSIQRESLSGDHDYICPGHNDEFSPPGQEGFVAEPSYSLDDVRAVQALLLQSSQSRIGTTTGEAHDYHAIGSVTSVKAPRLLVRHLVDAALD